MDVLGNRGKCAQPCRLSYNLLDNDKKIDNGYLLSTRDLCALDFIPRLVSSGVKCLKIEGRMKSPEYVATVTRIYRNYIDLALSDMPYKIDPEDRKTLMQVFNRGSFSNGHLDSNPNQDLIFKDKPNNMGLFLGIVEKYNKNKGYITLKLKEKIEVGDSISLENESGLYNVSELMENDKNITNTNIGQTVTIGRMKGNIDLGDKIYKMSSKKLNLYANESFKRENIKIPLSCIVTVKKEVPISISIKSLDSNNSIYNGLDIFISSNMIPVEANNRPIDAQSVISQISKTTSTPYEFENITVDLEDNLFVPKLSALNELRRNALEQVELYALNNIKRKIQDINDSDSKTLKITSSKQTISNQNTKISLLLNNLDLDNDYSKLENIDNLYIPLKYFCIKKYENILKSLSSKFKIYIYLPTIIKANYKNLFFTNIENAINDLNISGIVLSNISNIKSLEDLKRQIDISNLELIANYTFNIFNEKSIEELKKLDIIKYTLSPELDKSSILDLCLSNLLENELIVYGKIPLLNINYCLLGKTNKCYPSCDSKCNKNSRYYLKDRLNMNFLLVPDNLQTVSTVYNCKTTSISINDFNIDCARIDILDETIDEINNIINVVKSGNRLEGKDYTNGNLNRII